MKYLHYNYTKVIIAYHGGCMRMPMSMNRWQTNNTRTMLSFTIRQPCRRTSVSGDWHTVFHPTTSTVENNITTQNGESWRHSCTNHRVKVKVKVKVTGTKKRRKSLFPQRKTSIGNSYSSVTQSHEVYVQHGVFSYAGSNGVSAIFVTWP